jgi:hypothetical protein
MTEPLWTQADLISLKTAVASGVLTVRYDGPPGRTVTYQNLGEMRALLTEMRQELSRATGARSYRFATTRKGF